MLPPMLQLVLRIRGKMITRLHMTQIINCYTDGVQALMIGAPIARSPPSLFRKSSRIYHQLIEKMLADTVLILFISIATAFLSEGE